MTTYLCLLALSATVLIHRVAGAQYTPTVDPYVLADLYAPTADPYAPTADPYAPTVDPYAPTVDPYAPRLTQAYNKYKYDPNLDPSLSLRPSHPNKNGPAYRQGADPNQQNEDPYKNVNYRQEGQIPNQQSSGGVLNVDSSLLGLGVGVAQPSSLLGVKSSALGVDVGVAQPDVNAAVGSPDYQKGQKYAYSEYKSSNLVDVNSKTLGADVGVAQPNVNLAVGPNSVGPYPQPTYAPYPDLVKVNSQPLGLNVNV